jgi:hypothetical protein
MSLIEDFALVLCDLRDGKKHWTWDHGEII